MTEEQIKAFITWLATKQIVLAGPVENWILGASYLQELHPDDVPLLIADAVKELNHD